MPDLTIEQDLTCVFSLKVKRTYHSEQELTLMSEKERRYLTASSGQQTMYYSLKDEKGDEKTYTLAPTFFGIVTNLGTMFGVGSLISSLIGWGSIVGCIAPGFGKIKEDTGRNYDDKIDFKITREKYDRIKKSLTGFKYRPFNIFTYNCATYGIGLAKKNGLDVPKRKVITLPFMISNHIHKMHALSDKMKNDFQTVSARPRKISGVAVTLLDRLKTPERLGLD